MKNKEKKVIILDNLSSPFISQAIIILKEDIPVENEHIIKEAEAIVEKYFIRTKNSAKKTPIALLGGMFICGLILFLIALHLF